MPRQSIEELISHEDLRSSLLNSVGIKRRGMLPGVLNEAFYASLQLNEGRPVRFAVLLEDETFRSGPVNLFSKPRRFDARELQLISVAFDARRACLVVDHASSDSSCLEIIGVAARPVPTFRLPTQYPPAIIVEAVDPAVISLEVGETKAIFNKGVIARASLQAIERLPIHSTLPEKSVSTAVFGLYLNIGANAAIGLDEKMWASYNQEYEQLVGDYWPRLFSASIETLIRKAVSKRHGGGFLFLKRDINKSLFRDGSWFDEPNQQLTHCLSRALAIQGLLSLALRGKAVTADLDQRWRENPQEWARDLLSPVFREARLSLDQACAECAHLSEADGVTVLSHDFEVIGFGISICVSGKEVETPPQWEEYLTTRGNRHKSMANAVALIEDSIGIVVSQDGDVTIFSNDGGHDKQFAAITL